MTVAAHPASQTRSPSSPAARQTATALTLPHPKIPFDRRIDAKPGHALDQRASYSPVPLTRLRLNGLRSDARDLPAIYKSPQRAPRETAPFNPRGFLLGRLSNAGPRCRTTAS